MSTLAAVRRKVHDVNPKPGARAHWLAMVLHLPLGMAEPKAPFQLAAAVPEASSRSGLRELRVVGAKGPVRSTIGLEARDVTFERATNVDVPVVEHHAMLAYVLAGRARVVRRSLSAGCGLLMEGMPYLSISGERGTRLVWASVPRPS